MRRRRSPTASQLAVAGIEEGSEAGIEGAAVAAKAAVAAMERLRVRSSILRRFLRTTGT
jgi:hypothetical protein